MFTRKQKERLGTASAIHTFTATNCIRSPYRLPVTTTSLGHGMAVMWLKGHTACLGTPGIQERLGKTWVLSGRIEETWLHRTLRRL